MENQNELDRVNLFLIKPPKVRVKLCHSLGLNLLTRNMLTLTATYAMVMQAHNHIENGSMKENTPGFCFSGLLIIILIQVSMKGFEKSTTLSRSAVIVNGAIAKSAT